MSRVDELKEMALEYKEFLAKCRILHTQGESYSFRSKYDYETFRDNVMKNSKLIGGVQK